MKNFILLFLLILNILLFWQCSKNTSAPPPPDNEPDTTSHEFTWEIMQFGRPSSSYLNDVAIIDENNIWAVGIIHTDETDRYDSLGNWVDPFNAVHWDGLKWELKRILYRSNIWEISSIFALSSIEIWFDAFVRWDGANFIQLTIPNILMGYGINKVWSSSNNDLYVVGTQGLIAHYNGQNWQQIESGIPDIVNDIYGYQDSNNPNDQKILCATGDAFDTPNGKLLSIEADQSVQEFPWVSPTVVNSVWLNSASDIFACGVGVWQYRDSQWQAFTDLPGVLWERIRGNAANDVFVCGHVGYAAHFNGKTWQSFKLLDNALFTSLAVKDDLVVIVGGRAEVIVGRRAAN